MKKEKESIFQIITNYLKQFRFIIIIALIVILFPDLINKFYERYYEKYIIKVLLYFDRSFLSDIILLLFVSYLLFWTYIKLKIKFYLKNTYVIYSLLLAVLYTIARIHFKDQLLGTFLINFIKYTDLLYIILAIPIILKFSIYINKVESNQNNIFFLSDEPIKEPKDDILNRKNMAAQVVRLIKMYNPKSSLAIGIVGSWGYGKTSFMNIVENSFIDDGKYIIVHFNSWLNISISSIINDFFDTIEKEISKHSIDASKEFKKYGNQVLSINKTQITEVISNLVNIIPDKSLSQSFEELNKLLNEIDKKVIVFFDDLDRLQPNEVFEVLKLIRNTASFDTFNYIVGYDKPYLIKSLEYNMIPFPEKYCEKIFIKEFQLPPITQSNINDYIKDNLLAYFPQKQNEIQEAFDNVSILTEINAEIDIFKSIISIRNAKRFIYEFFIGINIIIDEVELSEFLFIKLLKFSYYDTYLLLFNKDAYFENNENAYSGEMKYIHYRLKISKKNNRSTLRDTFENTYLYNDLQLLNIYDKSQLKNIENICNQLFKLYNNHNITPLSIMYGSNYFKYFEDEISEINYRIKDFEKFMKSDFDEQKKIINQLDNENKLSGLVLFLYKIDVFKGITSKHHYENFIKSLFYIGSLKLETSYNKYRGIDFEMLRNVTNNFENSLVKKFGYNIDELKKLIHDILYQEKENYYFEADYVKFLFKQTMWSHELINKDQMEAFLIFCFDHEAKKIHSIDEHFSNCYRLCFLTQYSSGESIKTKIILEINKEKLIYNIIPQFLDEFLLRCIILHEDEDYVNEYTGKVGLPNNDPMKIFGSPSIFIEYLESDKLLQNLPKASEFLTEFIVFAKKVLSEEKFIDFDFTYPPAIGKIQNALTNQEL